MTTQYPHTTPKPGNSPSPGREALQQLASHLKADGGLHVVVASGNDHKVVEYGRMVRGILAERINEQFSRAGLPPLELVFTSYKECCPRFVMPPETGSTFEENALIKAGSVARELNRMGLGDDSGLCVDALDGGPGLHSARYGGEGATDGERRTKMLDELARVPRDRRTARFVCALALAFPGGEHMMFNGRAPGHIAVEEAGSGGFGYDPIFLSDELGGLSFGKATPRMKDEVSHRGKALRQFVQVVARVWEQIHGP